MKRLIAAALLALATSTALAAPVVAGTDATAEAVPCCTIEPSGQQSAHGRLLSGDRSATELPHRLLSAKNTRPKRRARTIQPASRQLSAPGTNDRGSAKAQVDCSIQSHPDCQPTPHAPKSIDHVGAYNFKVEIY